MYKPIVLGFVAMSLLGFLFVGAWYLEESRNPSPTVEVVLNEEGKEEVVVDLKER